MTALLAAFLLDLKLGDPFYRFHPVRVMGRIIEKGESFLRALITSEKTAGAVLAFFLPVAAAGLVWGILQLLYRVYPALAWAANVYGIYSSVSVHDLRKEALIVHQNLEAGDLPEARKSLARIVGRDTAGLDEKETVRAAVETVAESTLDGVVAPLFYAALGGAPLALAYKAVNTLDSMIGHMNERYRDFGYFAAKQDEFWNLLPALLSHYVSSAAAVFTTGRGKQAFAAGWRDGVTARNGNGAMPEAAFAGALGLRLGGVNYYEGREVRRPFLGAEEAEKDFDREDIPKSCRLMLAASWVSLAAAVSIHLLSRRF